MRFLLLTQYFPPEIGAPQVRLAAVTRELLRFGHTVEVVTALPNYPQGKIFPEYQKHFYQRDEWEGVQVHRVWVYAAMGAGWRRLFNYFSFLITAGWGLWKSQRPDYLLVESPPLFLGITAYVAAKLWQVPLILNVADLWPDSVSALGLMHPGLSLTLAEKLEAWLYQKASYINAVTEGIRDTLIHKKMVFEKKVLFLPNGVDLQLFQPYPPDAHWRASLGLADKPMILYTGTQGYAHGVEVLLQTAQLLSEVLFLLVGGGSEKARLQQLSHQMQLPNVIFWEPQSPAMIARLYSLAVAGVSTLRKLPLFEGTRPVKMLATMACGKPVLYSGAGEGARLVTEAQAGLIVAPEDAQALAVAIRYLLSHPEEARQWGEHGRAYVEKYLPWSKVVAAWLQEFLPPSELA